MKPFSFSAVPKSFFGEGCLLKIIDILKQEGKPQKVLLITGQSSFISSVNYTQLMEGLGQAGHQVVEARVAHEPSPELVDDITNTTRSENAGLVIAVGGGSVLDTGKAVSAMVPVEGSVVDYLEGVGTKLHSGIKVPFIAVPTTSGTGSEATKNAVLSRIGEKGFKKSLRHDRFIPDYALLDPLLSLHCPALVTAASGMDALNQLLEGYMSEKGNPLTEDLALSGIQRILMSLERLCLEEPQNKDLRGQMAYAAYLSGLVLANAGLGYVHGFAGVIGGFIEIPHGVVCGKLNGVLFEAVARRVLQDPQSEAYRKLLKLSQMAVPHETKAGVQVDALIERLYRMEEVLNLPSFSSYGADEALLKKAVSMTSRKECPVSLEEETLVDLVLSKL
jgi:alcohol dehydrogenase class IV